MNDESELRKFDNYYNVEHKLQLPQLPHFPIHPAARPPPPRQLFRNNYKSTETTQVSYPIINSWGGDLDGMMENLAINHVYDDDDERTEKERENLTQK